jgi:hypothetical protein
MELKQLIETSYNELTRVLSFFPRVDTQISFLFAIGAGMLGGLGASLSSYIATFKISKWCMLIVPVMTLLLIFSSFLNLYFAAFPNLEGSSRKSLIYFKDISSRSENEYTELFRTQHAEDYLQDLLSQTWRNSQILTEKYKRLQWAFIFLGLSLIPWVFSLIVLQKQ